MTRRRWRRALAVAGALAGLVLVAGAPATAADDTHIDHVEAADDGQVSVLLGVDGIPEETPVDMESVRVSLDGEMVDASAQQVEAGEIERITILALDASDSMRGGKFVAAKKAARTFLEQAPEDVQVGLITFSGTVQVLAEPTADHAAVIDTLDDITLTPGTNVYDAVIGAVNLSGLDGARSVLLLSDGQDRGKGAALMDAVDAARDNEVIVDVVSLDQAPAHRTELQRIAGASGGQVIAATPDALSGVFESRAQALASQLVVTFQPPEDAAEEVNLEVSVDAGGTTYTDRAFVTLPKPDTGATTLTPDSPLIGRLGFAVGAAALGLGLATVLAITFIGRPTGPTLVQRQVAHHSGIPIDPALIKGRQESLRTSAVALTEKVVSGDFESRLATRLSGAGSGMTPAEWLLVHAGIVVAGGAVGVLLRKPALAALLVALGVAVPWVWLKIRHSRRLAAFHSQLAETLQLIAGGLTAGLSMPQAIDTVVREGAEPMSGELRRALIEQRLGVEIDDALEAVAQRMESQDFGWVVMAIRIQREVGGNLSELLHTVADTLRERDFLRRQVRVLSAEGRTSAWILGALPLVMFAYLALFKPDLVRVFYTTGIGVLLGVIAVFLLLIGFWSLAKMIKVEV